MGVANVLAAWGEITAASEDLAVAETGQSALLDAGELYRDVSCPAALSRY